MRLENIIFLDIDGVLNHSVFFKRRAQKKINDCTEFELDQCIQGSTVRLLNMFSESLPYVGIVISSTRRLDKDAEGWTNLFKNLGVNIPVIGITPFCTSRVRGAEIKSWLTDVYSFDPDFLNYVIFDDDNDMLINQAPNFFQTDPDIGLTKEITQNAINFLSKNYA